MKAIRNSISFLSILVVVTSCSLQKNKVDKNQKSKEISSSVEALPNYLWHVFAISNLWDGKNSLYSEKYGHTIPKEDISIMHNNRSLIAWGNGASGKFTKLLFFIPLHKKNNFSDYCKYLDEMIAASEKSEWETFARKYCDDEADIEIVTAYAFHSTEIKALDSIAKVLKNNYKQFEKTAWKDIKPILDRQAQLIDSFFRGKNIIEKWEKNLDMEYPGNFFVPVLTYANAIDNLPSANNLSSTRNNFGITPKYTDYTIKLIQHEIGIFILMPTILSLFNDTDLQTDYINSNSLIYQAVESFIEKKKANISGKSEKWEGELFGGGQFDFQWFFEYYEQHEKKYKAEMLLKNAILSYERNHK